MYLGSTAYADGISFEHKDWQIVCDNTLTCRAAGYSVEDAKNRVTVLLVRKAGIGQDVSALVKFADIDDQTVKTTNKVTLKIADKSYGKLGSESIQDINDKQTTNSLTKEQTQILILALKGTSKIAFVDKNEEWVLPGDGAVAVLLKMDEVQGRVGTSSALIKKGNQPESKVLPALPKPVIFQKPLIKGDPKSWQSKVNWYVLKQKLSNGKDLGPDKERGDYNSCDLLIKGDSEYNKFDPKVVAILPNNQLLISGLCARGAYNEVYGYWIINQQEPYQPKLITTMADGAIDDIIEGDEISSSSKDRGIGDCWSHKSWIWNGKNFVKAYDGNSGICRNIEAGGAWNLPTYVTTVK
ncbi:Invasion protein IalB [Commensalibacter papalotli (ex Botero et al. 2024)]|uniref:Involved in pathogenesis (IalB) (PDB:3DTD) n=1 Tax=Commensalibacter papalotli (ex Botero et al. 2024) TaxID=2972766 RepID=A0ABM9HMV7_9PROT|nr:Invasion protein IalB [Commensalibacter papalotli (ex Botero et al. 2024)]